MDAYSGDTSAFWTPPEYWDTDDIALEVSDAPYIWTDGTREDFSSTGGFEVAGAGVYVLAPEVAFEGSVWGVAEEYENVSWSVAVLLCRPGSLQTVQRAEFWGATIALQSHCPCLLGMDNLNVAKSIDRLLDRGCMVKPLLGCSCTVHDPG